MENYKIKMKDKIGYALGDTGGLLTFGLISSFLQMFYTDSLGIDAKKIALLMLIARIWDAINDPMWGSFIDSRKPTKNGRFRPYILGAAIPMSVAALIMFTKFNGLSETQYLIFAYITYIIYGMLYTGVNIPYGSLASVITDDEIERSSLSMWRSIGAGLGGLPAQIVLPLVVYTTASNGAKILDSTKLTVSVAVLCAISVVVYVLHYKLTVERVALPEKQAESNFNILKTMKALLKNRPFISLCIVSMLLIAYQMYTQSAYNYLFKNYYNQPKLYSLVTIFTYLPMALFLPFMGKLVRRFGKKEICCAGIGFSAVVNVLMYLIRFTPIVKSSYVFLALVFFSGAGMTFLVLEVWALVMDVIDYHELLSHRREEGSSYSFYSFARKLGQTIAGAGFSLMLGIIGYSNEDAISVGQSQEVLDKLYDISTLIPAVMLVIMFVVLFFGYTLSKSKLAELRVQLEAERNNA